MPDSSSTRRRAAVSLGSNEGDRMAHLRAAFAWCGTVAEGTIHVSAVYETDPVGCAPGTPAFLNAALVFVTSCEPGALLLGMRAFERERGRLPSAPRNAPRSLDMDLLLLGELRMEGEELSLPHPRMFQRRFVLQPLCELAPSWVAPGTDRTLKDFLDLLPSSGDVRRWKENL
jgi:2-amino-4-hydroxy-6-hydroxymethyldihydropteridine diphosphokinase